MILADESRNASVATNDPTLAPSRYRRCRRGLVRSISRRLSGADDGPTRVHLFQGLATASEGLFGKRGQELAVGKSEDG